jgi:hypothetical protein
MAKTLDLTKVVTQCSGCHARTLLNVEVGTAAVQIPSNGKRGSLHVPAHTVSTSLWTTDDYLWMWDCPACEYADSWTEDEA